MTQIYKLYFNIIIDMLFCIEELAICIGSTATATASGIASAVISSQKTFRVQLGSGGVVQVRTIIGRGRYVWGQCSNCFVDKSELQRLIL